jgi:hypothetical protein
VEKCGKCGKMWENVGKCGKMWENVEKCGKMWKNVGKCGKIWKNVGKCIIFFTKKAILMWRSTVPTLSLQLGFPGVPILAKIRQKKLFERVHNRFKLKPIRYYQIFFFVICAKAG